MRCLNIIKRKQIKIKKQIVLDYIKKYEEQIQKEGDETIPKIEAELDAESRFQEDISDGVGITHYDRAVIEIVLSCWSIDRGFKDWIKEMEVAQKEK